VRKRTHRLGADRKKSRLSKPRKQKRVGKGVGHESLTGGEGDDVSECGYKRMVKRGKNSSGGHIGGTVERTWRA